MQSLEQLVETCRKYIDLATAIEFVGHESLKDEEFNPEDSITLYRVDSGYTTIKHEKGFELIRQKGVDKVFYDLDADFESINKDLSDFFDKKMPDFSENYQKDNLRIELEKIEQRRESLKKLLGEPESN